MATLTFSLKGTAQMKRNLRRLDGRMPNVIGKALFAEGEAIMNASKRIVPVDTGALRSSGNVQLPKREAGKVTVTLSYGGAAAPYAVAVHEIPPPPRKSPGGRSARHTPPQQYKFLEMPFRAAQVGMAQRLAARVKRDVEASIR